MSDDTLISGENPTEGTTENPTTVAQEGTSAQDATVQQESPAATNSWYSDEYAGLIESKGFKSADDVLKSYKNLEAMTGNSIRIPSEDASDEAKQDFFNKIKGIEGVLVKGDEEFYNKLGRPETADGYKFDDVLKAEVVNNLPGVDQELEDFKSIAHEIGLTDEQAAKLVDMRMSALTKFQDNTAIARQESEQTLRKVWGADFDNRLDAAKKVAGIYTDKYGEQMEQLIHGPAGNNPAFLEILSELAGTFKEKGHEGMSGSQLGDTPEIAQQKIAEMKSDRGFMKAYNDAFHPGHKAAVAKMANLYKLANGTL